MVEQKIEFRKTRDFGENLNDTFLFIRLNFKPLLKSFFAICAIFMLTQAILEQMLPSIDTDFIDVIVSRSRLRTGNRREYFNVQYLVLKIVKWMTFVSVQVALGSYIKYYIENNGKKPGIEEVWTLFKRYFFRILLFTLPFSFAILIGLFLCIIPGVYLIIVFLPFPIIAMMEDTSVAETNARCFDLIRNHFWISFLTYFVVIIIYVISLSLTSLLVSGIYSLAAYLTTGDMVEPFKNVESFINIFSLCFYVVVMVSICLHYCNLVEIRDGSGILDRINKIGDGDMIKSEGTDGEY